MKYKSHIATQLMCVLMVGVGYAMPGRVGLDVPLLGDYRGSAVSGVGVAPNDSAVAGALPSDSAAAAGSNGVDLEAGVSRATSHAPESTSDNGEGAISDDSRDPRPSSAAGSSEIYQGVSPANIPFVRHRAPQREERLLRQVDQLNQQLAALERDKKAEVNGLNQRLATLNKQLADLERNKNAEIEKYKNIAEPKDCKNGCAACCGLAQCSYTQWKTSCAVVTGLCFAGFVTDQCLHMPMSTYVCDHLIGDSSERLFVCTNQLGSTTDKLNECKVSLSQERVLRASYSDKVVSYKTHCLTQSDMDAKYQDGYTTGRSDGCCQVLLGGFCCCLLLPVFFADKQK